MGKERINYYILFANYTQGMMLQSLLRDAGIPSKIAPTPKSIQGELGCGMSILVQPEDIDDVRQCIRDHDAEYYDIVAIPCRINPNRDKYC